MGKNNGHNGSIKPLNWSPPPLVVREAKVLSHAERLNAFSRHGTPVTNRGAFHGAVSALEPATPAELNPPLVINKAVLRPVKYGPKGAQFERKRDASGKFSSHHAAEQESTAKEEKTQQERKLQLKEHQKLDKLRKLKTRAGEAARPSAKKALGTDPLDLMGQNDNNVNPLGATQSGKTIMDDPAHSEHGEFSADDHSEAEDMNAQMSQQAAGEGDQGAALMMRNNADAHSEMASDAMTPGDRFIDNAMGSDAPVNDGNLEDPQMDELSNLLAQPDGPAGGMGNPEDDLAPPGGAGPQDDVAGFLNPNDVDQNKPLGSPPQDGPKPGMMDNRTGDAVGPQTDIGQAISPPQPVIPGGDPGMDAQPPMPDTCQSCGGDPMGGQPDPMLDPNMGAQGPMPPDPMMGEQGPPPPMMGADPMGTPPPMDAGMGMPPNAPPGPPMDPNMGAQPPMPGMDSTPMTPGADPIMDPAMGAGPMDQEMGAMPGAPAPAIGMDGGQPPMPPDPAMNPAMPPGDPSMQAPQAPGMGDPQAAMDPDASDVDMDELLFGYMNSLDEEMGAGDSDPTMGADPGGEPPGGAEEQGFGAEAEDSQNPTDQTLNKDKDNLEVPDSNAGAPGPMPEQNRDEDDKAKEAQDNAIKALMRYARL